MNDPTIRVIHKISLPQASIYFKYEISNLKYFSNLQAPRHRRTYGAQQTLDLSRGAAILLHRRAIHRQHGANEEDRRGER